MATTGRIAMDELHRSAVELTNFDPVVVDFDDGDALQVDIGDDLSYISVDELCLYSHTGCMTMLILTACLCPQTCYTPGRLLTFVGRINRPVARATSEFSLEYLEIRVESLNESYGALPLIRVTLGLYFPRSSHHLCGRSLACNNTRITSR
ncbi:hypothetical protein BDZ89DRAFT_471541 [Hymenopellis radicata]|nr:hypothetical protein BDZ89DRAFT_471541 [Hymenopellis radicata]